MENEARYDKIDTFYAEFVADGQRFATSVTAVSANMMMLKVKNRLNNATVLDLACGEGHLARRFVQENNRVIGVDISEKLLTFARQQSGDATNIQFIQDDAQTLTTIERNSIDLAVCNMALMDIPDCAATFQAVWGCLRENGRFLFSILHPCFESPFDASEGLIETKNDQFEAVRVKRYLEEGYWNSGGDGMRGRVGAYHRTVSTYLNTLIQSGFELVAIDEPHLPEGTYQTVNDQWFSRIPRLFIVEARKKEDFLKRKT